MGKKNTVMFIGRYGLLYTDAEGMIYNIHIDRIRDTGTLLRNGITPINRYKRLTAEDADRIIDKVLELTPEVKWEII